MSPHRFMAASVGYSGSKWLASWLHRHPLIACSHGANGPEADFGHEVDLGAFVGGGPGHDRYQAARKAETPLEKIFAELETAFPEARAVGNAHMFTIHETDTPDRKRRLAEAGVVVMNLTRHPVSYMYSIGRASPAWLERVESDPDEWRRCQQFIDRFTAYAGTVVVEEGFEDLAPKIALRPENGRAAFERAVRLMALSWTRNVVRELVNYRHAPTIVMERMVSDVDYLSGVLDTLTGGVADQDYARRMIEGGRINDHHKEYALRPADPLAPAEYFAATPEWQQEGFRRIRRKYAPDAALAPLGYRFDFID